MSAVLIIKPTEPIPGHLHREGVVVTPWEAVTYDMICEAAEAGQVCPKNFDIGCAVGASAVEYVGSKQVARLAAKGLLKIIEVGQRFRIVQVVATGKTTKRSPHQHVERPHVPRGAGSRSPVPTERKVYRKGRL